MTTRCAHPITTRVGSLRGHVAGITVALVCLWLHGASAAEVRGKMIDTSATLREPMPSSSERERQSVSDSSGMTSGDVLTFHEDDVADPATVETKAPHTRPLCGPADAKTPEVPFRVSIDGKPVDDADMRPEADRQRCVDVALEKADIRIHYDPLAARPALNVWTTPTGALRTGPVPFHTYTNYALWIRKAEVRIFEKGKNSQQQPYAVVPVTPNEQALWAVPEGAPETLYFLLRVYDEAGRFDETAGKELTLLTRKTVLADEEAPERERLIGHGGNSRTLINIPVRGGTVTVDGSSVPSGSTVKALGVTVPVDRNGKFAMRQIMPAGPSIVEVSVTDARGAGMIYRRSISIPDNDWFYIGLADLTVGTNSTTGPARLVTGDESRRYDNKAYIDGRGAFYLKGLIKGEYLLTMSADTRERPIQDLFSNFDAKDPQSLLRRIDPDVYYPVYGDDSTIAEDAPTQGKFYVKIERGDSSVMWGNFQTQWTGTELTQYSRGLYGANLVFAPSDTTSYGERRTTLNAFGADPGTLSSREEFRGTGGSLYYLRHMDITQGSERIWVEVRDKDSLLTLERRQLAPAQDYEVNYVQGRILLRAPLPSVADGSTLVQTSTLNGNPVFLVVTYEYVPGVTATNDLAAGIRATHWFGDLLRLGITGYRQGEDQSAQWLKGADVILRYRPGTYVKGEFARSEGAGTGQLTSITGGFDFARQAGTDGRADAWRLEGALDLSELWQEARGRLAAYWQHRDRGFSGPGMVALDNERLDQAGLLAQLPIGERTTIDLKGDGRDAESQTFRAVEGNIRRKLGDEFTLSVGARHDDRTVHTPNASAILSEDGSRTDAIVRLDFRPLLNPEQAPEGQGAPHGSAGTPPSSSTEQASAQTAASPAPAPLAPESPGQARSSTPSSAAAIAVPRTLRYAPWGVFAYAQGTLSTTGNRRDNDRIGAGGFWQATPRFTVGSELSTGDGGLGGKLSGDYRIDDRSNVYLTYTMETERPDSIYRGRMGTLVFGSGYKLSDQVRVYGESKWAEGAGPDSLVQAFGLDYAPNDRWTYGVKAEYGTISDELSGDLDRKALGASVAYKFEKTKFSSALEYRDESGTLGDRHTWLIRNAVGYQANPSLRLLGKFNTAFSDSSQGALFDANYMEGVAGVAFRPVKHDKLNALFKYTYYYNVPSPGQTTLSNLIADYAQRSHVLSVDTIYDLFPWLSVGGKYGFRCSELKQTKVDGAWFDSQAHLVIVRSDLHFVKNWDALVEWRYLTATEADDAKSGILVGLYRHITDNVKIGAGYNFTRFSDNLTDLSYRSRGVFVNVVGSF